MADATEGRLLPSLTLEATEVGTLKLPNDLEGAWTLLYFYPKDDTPGCTKQACAYRDDSEKFKALGVKLFGVSLDDMNSHGAFRDKFSLNFPLISDAKHELADFFGVYGEREWQGKKYMGLARDTFLIDPQGKVARAFRGVNPLTTSQETLEVVQSMVGK
jgi:peroxiredoxin Q/BCP